MKLLSISVPGMLLAVAMAFILTACGGGSSSSNTGSGSTAGIVISGAGIKGIAKSARVVAQELQTDGTAKRQLGTAYTDANGHYSLALSASYGGGPILLTLSDAANPTQPTVLVCDVQSGCGNNRQYGFGMDYPIHGLVMMALVPGAGGTTVTAQITPLTTAAADSALAAARSGQPLTANLVSAENAGLGNLVGVSNILGTEAANLADEGALASAAAAQRDYAYLSAGIAVLAFTEYASNSDPLKAALAAFTKPAARGQIDVNDGGDSGTVSLADLFSAALSQVPSSDTAVTNALKPLSNAATLATAGTSMAILAASGSGQSSGYAYSISGTVSGLLGTGMVLQDNGADDLAISSDGSFTFNTPVIDGSNYNVTVLTQPTNPSQTCEIGGGAGTAMGVKVASVVISCTTNNSATGAWAWESGSESLKPLGSHGSGQLGDYGTKGTGAPTNVPGARTGAVSWIDSNDNLWLFGGMGFGSNGGFGYLNDLWRFDGTEWTWVSGSDTVGQSGVYGAKGVAASANVPGGRIDAVSWVDANGTFWLFGGSGYDGNGGDAELNDLWEFDGAEWTWVSGSDKVDDSASYGTKGVAASTNVPGPRYHSVSWIDTSGNLWLFGGSGFASGFVGGTLNDLWKFDGANWTWVSGSNKVGQPGVYGTKGAAAASNVPGARMDSVGWIDAEGNLWLFGGSFGNGIFNDLWKFDGTDWTWVSGSDKVDQAGTYGTKGIAAGTNMPGARYRSGNWIDASGTLWLFGGIGDDSTGASSYLNDLWKFDGANWTWVSGSDRVAQSGLYGTKGSAAANNVPGARSGAITWADAAGHLWLFGGEGFGSGGQEGYLNDLWSYTP